MTCWTTCVFTGLARSGIVEAYVSNEGAVLARRFSDLQCCRVVIQRALDARQHVRISLALPRGVIHVAAAGSTLGSPDTPCELVGRAFDRAFAVLAVEAPRTARIRAASEAPPIHREAC